MKKLEQYYKKLLELSFPRSPIEQNLSEIYSNLVLLDGAYIGLAQRKLTDRRLRVEDINDILELENECNSIINIPGNEKEIFAEIKQRVHILKLMAEEIKNS